MGVGFDVITLDEAMVRKDLRHHTAYDSRERRPRCLFNPGDVTMW